MTRWCAVALLFAGCSSAPQDRPVGQATLDLRYGSRLLLEGHLEDAEESLWAAYDGATTGAESWSVRTNAAIALGDLNRLQGRLDESVRWYETFLAAAVDPRASGRLLVVLRLAQVLRDLGREEDVTRIVEEERGLMEDIYLKPRRPEWARANLLHAERRDVEAIRELETALAGMDDPTEEVYRYQLQGALAHILLETGEPEQAIPHYRHAIEKHLEAYAEFRGGDYSFALVPTQIELACALNLAGQTVAAVAVEDQISRKWENARALGYDPRSPYFEPSRIRECAPYALVLTQSGRP